jgi:hypothetical protein
VGEGKVAIGRREREKKGKREKKRMGNDQNEDENVAA